MPNGRREMTALTTRSPFWNQRAAFTLVELLVVIAIIGTLVGLLLPAVQVAREAARRSQCTNNLKQLALAIQNFHDARKTFPSGGTGDLSSVDRYGHSWIADILPFFEYADLYAKIDFKTASYSRSTGTNYNATGTGVVNQARLPTLVCPSTPFSRTAFGPTESGSYTQTAGTQIATYVGICGADKYLFGSPGTPLYDREDARDVVGSSANYGRIGSGGILIPHGAKPSRGPAISLRSVTDGSSKTLLLSEISDYFQKADGSLAVYGAGTRWGWFAGIASGPSTATLRWSPPDAPTYGWAFHGLTTLRYAINDKYKIATSDTSTGTGNSTGNNLPLVSAHGGGVVAAFADGSVGFLNDQLPTSVLARLATRDDGESVSNAN